MPVVELIALLQSSDSQLQTSNPSSALLIVLALAGAVLALIVLVFIRTSMKRPTKRASDHSRRGVAH